MQRQSLGSPNSIKQTLSLTSGGTDLDEEDPTAKKLNRSTSASIRSVHLIPLLILVSFLILYLISHEPSISELPKTRGIDRIIDRKGSVSGIMSAAAIRTNRGLMEEIGEKKYQYRRLGIR